MLLCSTPVIAKNFDYFETTRQTVRNGMQSMFICNGLFTSQRSLGQIFEQELAYLGNRRLGDANNGNYRIDYQTQSVEVGGGHDGPAVTAVFRSGIGCLAMAPGMTVENVAQLPKIEPVSPKKNTEQLPWPHGDLINRNDQRDDVSHTALVAAAHWAFTAHAEGEDTTSLLVVHRGNIVFERYASGFDYRTRTRTWSAAKSIEAALIGLRVDSGHMELDTPLPIDWLPQQGEAGRDPRSAITLRHALNMTTGLYPVDNGGMADAAGSGLAYWSGSGYANPIRQRGLIRDPGSHWDYENYDSLLAVHALKKTFETDLAYRQFPYTELLGKIGMHSTLLGTDRFGDFILSSQAFSNARDLARFGLLFLNQGNWSGEQIISEDWIDFIKTPTPASAFRGNDYGGHWWLVPDARKQEVPADAFSAAGSRGQYVTVVPSYDVVIVRRGLDYNGAAFDQWSLVREVLKAFPEPTDKH
ncbi:MAG: serine hydrolase [Luminiphilus sp.]|nr:serine hydrolase [Luminiphilus sp.]